MNEPKIVILFVGLVFRDLNDKFELEGRQIRMEIFKILLKQEWHDLKLKRQTHGSTVDQTDGFIHFSTAGQLRKTASKHFSGWKEIVVLGCDTELMEGTLKWEMSRGGEPFPHLYGPMDVKFVIWNETVNIVNDAHVFPERIPFK